MDLPSATQSGALIGFGDSAPDTTQLSLSQADRIRCVALRVLVGCTILAGTATILVVAIPSMVTALLVGAAALALTICAVRYVRACIQHKVAQRRVDQEIRTQLLAAYSRPSRGRVGVEVLPTSDVTFERMKELIRSAESSVTIANAFCGGLALDEVLQLLGEKLDSIPDFRVNLLITTTFLTDDNRTHLERLSRQYPDRFIHPQAGSHIRYSPRLKAVNTHVKAMAIDGGRYCIVGSTGIEDQYLRRPDRAPPNFLKRWVLSDRFQDMDVLLSDQGDGVGRTLYFELLKLISVWRTHRGDMAPNSHMRSESLDTTPLEEVRGSEDTAELLLVAPEHRENQFTSTVLEQIRSAQESITIAHLYFHPPREVLAELAAALERGVRIQIYTNGSHPESPRTHSLFVRRTLLNIRDLASAVDDSAREQLSVHLYRDPGVTLHKKVMVIDRARTLIGSANLGTKSMVTNSEYELDLLIRSQSTARQTVSAIEEYDLPHCQTIDLSDLAGSQALSTRLLGRMQQFVGALIG